MEIIGTVVKAYLEEDQVESILGAMVGSRPKNMGATGAAMGASAASTLPMVAMEAMVLGPVMVTVTVMALS
jgi:hypothetical protein